MTEVMRILMQRDGMTEDEARAKQREVNLMIRDCMHDYDEVEEILMEELGLEMDYVFDVM